MQSNVPKIITASVFCCLLLVSCSKNETKFFADADTKDLSIFSNTGNNIFTCFVNDRPWRTIDRRSGGFLSFPISEMQLFKNTDSTLQSMLVIKWYGAFVSDTLNETSISVYLPVPPTFTNKDINSLQGKRLILDTAHAYFITDIGMNYERGSGTIYFDKASFDSTETGQYAGYLSGLLEANFSTLKITSGRFDHKLTSFQVEF